MKTGKKNSAALTTFLVVFASREVAGFVPARPLQSLQTRHKSQNRAKRTLGRRRERSLPSLFYTQDDDITGGNIPKPSSLHIDTSCYESHIDSIHTWLSSLTKVERSEPTWLGASTNEGDGKFSSDIMSISPSLLIQEHLDAMYTGFHAPVLFPTEADRTKFDFEWRYALLSVLPQNDLDQVLTCAQSNSHPLSMTVA